MTMSVESFTALSNTAQELLAAAFSAGVNRALDATTDPASWDDGDLRALDGQLLYCKHQVEHLAKQGFWPWSLEARNALRRR